MQVKKMNLTSLFKPNVSGKGVAWNTTVKAVTILFTVIIDLYYTRFLLAQLGSSPYGLIALTTNTIQITSILTYVIISSMGRFATIEVHRGDTQTANQVFNVGFFSILFLSLFFLIPGFSCISWFSPSLFIVPAGMENASRFLFVTVLFSFIIVSVGSSLSIGAFIYNRLDLIDLLNFVKIIVSRGITVSLILFTDLGLYSIGIGLFIAAILNIKCSIMFFKGFTKYIDISLKCWDKDLFNKMGAFSLWILIRQLGGRALVYLDLIIVNQLYGPAETGLYGIAFFFSSKLKIMTGTFASLFNPVLLTRYAKGDIDGMLDISCRGMRVIGLAFAMPVGLLCGFYRPIFHVWVGAEYEHLALLAVCLTIHVGVNTTTYLLSGVLSAVGRVKIPAILSIIFAVANVLLAVLMGHPNFGLGVKGVAIAGLISLTLNNAIFTPLYVGCVLKKSPLKIYAAFIPGLLGLCVAYPVALIASRYPIGFSLFGLLLMVSVSIIVCVPIFWFLSNEADRHWILSLIKNKFKK